MQKFPLMPQILRQFAQAESQSSEDAGADPEVPLHGPDSVRSYSIPILASNNS